ncbi:hypothetical protein SUGI_0074580 [Cryptomeria japonica]|uniref:scopoletin glucosyltransferase n=1 Tax=Cryptomeria japonica TaxID=3369 RepID=UPI002408C307|nr:scopoletin glucosyltransferase [Cryptomeria japonica]GLJ07815.1 hypothetical protein SUGI_0074580 [Cryptomeria japonica]
MVGLQKPHVVVLAFPALGHSIPLLDLSRLVASQGLTVSYVTTPANVSRFQGFVVQAVNNGIDLRLVVLPTPPVEGLPEGRESIDLLPKASHGLIFALASKLQKPFNAWMECQFEQQGASAPVCIVYDTFMGWGRESAQKFKICCMEFNVSGAFGVSMLISTSRSVVTMEKEEKQGKECVVLSLDLPWPHRFERDEIAQDFFNIEDPTLDIVLKILQSISTGSSGLIFNTFEELEPAYVQHLRNLTGKPVWAIGPMLPPNYFNGAVCVRGKKADVAVDELVQWLDSQSESSVVYVSFGSQIFFTEQQIKALARGLEASLQPFIWAIKVTPSIETATSCNADLAREYLPEGFLERTKDRGVIIWGWAPQLLILSHPSVGALMSHCGWNSTLESITLGVPTVGWPMFGDQFFNLRLLAELGMGIQFCEHIPGIPEEEKVKEVLRLVLCDVKGNEMRARGQKLKKMARKAVEEGGSSKADVQAFASEMHKLLKMRQEG